LQPGDWDAEIQCSLHEARLDSGDLYEALSYVWGDANDLPTIRLESCTYHVTINLGKALRYLRYADKAGVLWVDALCINQNDLKEREEQVKQMFAIYKNVSRVVSWTGEATEDSSQAIEIMNAAGSLLEDGKYEDEIESIQEDHPSAQAGAAFFERLGFPVTERNWEAVWNFLERPYWSRVWIIQELAADRILGKSRGVITCGKDFIPQRYYDYTCVMVILIMMGDPNYRVNTNDVTEPLKPMLLRGSHPPGLTMFQAIGSCFGDKVDKSGLEFLLRASKRFRASDPQDKIYALLGLAPERYRCITPDYAIPLDRTLMNLVRTLIEMDGNLNILLGNRFKTQDTQLGWVPEVVNVSGGETGWVPVRTICVPLPDPNLWWTSTSDLDSSGQEGL
jgi:hypothetical protein